MANIFVDPTVLSDPYPDNVMVDGICYDLVGGSETAIDTSTVDGEHADCDCDEDCPDCTSCNNSYTITISGLSGNYTCVGSPSVCTDINSASPYTVTQTGNPINCQYDGGSNYCVGSVGVVQLDCAGGFWRVLVQGFPGPSAAEWTAPVDLAGCPPATGWTRSGGSCVGGTCTVA